MTLRVLLVGEALGQREEQFHHGFVGPSGRELARILADAKLAPAPRVQYPTELDMIQHWRRLRAEGIAITNVFDEHPPNNDLDEFFARDGNKDLPALRPGKYILPRYMPHVLRLWDEVKSLRPNLVVCLGNSACWAVLGQTKITTIRGTVQRSERLGAKALGTFHPAAVLRQWSLRPIVVADFIKARRESEFPDIRRVERWITIPSPNAAGLREASAWFNRPASAYSSDIETAGGQITMVGFARSANDALVIPFWWDTRLAARPEFAKFMLGQPTDDPVSFWPSAELEVEAWRLVLRGLKRPVPKIGQNYLYDLSYFLRIGLVPTWAQGDDTMLRHHAMLPELPKSLGFLGSLYASESPWKLMGRTQSLKRDE